MKRMIAVLLVLAAGAGAGCYGYELVGPTPNQVPNFHVTVAINHGEQLTYSVNAWFERGTNETGTPRALSDSSLLIGGVAVQNQSRSPGALFFEWRDSLPASVTGPDSLIVRGPTVASMPGSARPLTIPILLRTDPFAVDVRVGEEVVLEVSPIRDTTLGLARDNGLWQLEIVKDSLRSARFTTQGAGRVPKELRIPWTWLEQSIAQGDTLRASLLVASSYHSPDAPFGVHVTTLARLSWRLIVVAPPTEP